MAQAPVEVCGVYLGRVGGRLAVLIDAGAGAGVLASDGHLVAEGEAWVTSCGRPPRQGRYTQAVCPWTPARQMWWQNLSYARVEGITDATTTTWDPQYVHGWVPL